MGNPLLYSTSWYNVVKSKMLDVVGLNFSICICNWLNMAEIWMQYVFQCLQIWRIHPKKMWWNVLNSQMAAITGVRCISACTYFGLCTPLDIGNPLPYLDCWWSCYIYSLYFIHLFYSTLPSCLCNIILYYFCSCIEPMVPQCLVKACLNCEAFTQWMI